MHPRPLVPIPVAGPPEDLARALRAALDGSGPAVAPIAGAYASQAAAHAPGAPTSPAPTSATDVAATSPAPRAPASPTQPAPSLPTHVPDDVALVLPTSGSTGAPRLVLLGADAVLASARATHARLGGPGRWVLTLPAQHVAGLQVVIRSLLAGPLPVVAPAGHFDPVAVAATIADAGGGAPRYASVVPTQLHRILADGVPDDARAVWARLDAVLVGGAAVAPALLDRAREAGIRVVTTYGMTETAGGCVYDGVPLDGVRVRVERDPRDAGSLPIADAPHTAGADAGAGAAAQSAAAAAPVDVAPVDVAPIDVAPIDVAPVTGVVHIAGPVLARGYLPAADDAFVVVDGERWFRTSDVGELSGGVLRVLGRADDVVVTGGVKVVPTAVEAVLADLGLEACVVGVPDEEWGQAVTAVVASRGPVDLETVRVAVAARLGRAAAPRALVVVDALPHRGPGKVDRAAVERLAVAHRS